ncbi:MAG: pyrroline-5-carboxylate reductase [Deltaproteobacteria bacterium]|nr:pyrroline-5-carboxylate reductase [Deltaproteobacteria bacterium]MDL1960623.1 pyrroline-5-carboxylate reductase [Deltaproteobacteria bacterium]
MIAREKIEIFETLGFVGGGQMAEALIRGLLSRELLKPGQITVSDLSEVRRSHLKKTFGINTTLENKEVVKGSEIIVLAVKPQVMAIVLEEIRPVVSSDRLVVSIAAGITILSLEKGLPEGTRVVRVMPNTPALVQAGAAALCKGTAARPGDLDIIRQILETVGKAVVVPESLMDAVTGLSGSGPAYVFTFIEGLIDAGVREGLPRTVAQELVVQTVLGAALMCQNTRKHPAELTTMVTSPGGTTVAGLHVLERGALRGIILDAVRAATERSRELGS